MKIITFAIIETTDIKEISRQIPCNKLVANDLIIEVPTNVDIVLLGPSNDTINKLLGDLKKTGYFGQMSNLM